MIVLHINNGSDIWNKFLKSYQMQCKLFFFFFFFFGTFAERCGYFQLKKQCTGNAGDVLVLLLYLDLWPQLPV